MTEHAVVLGASMAGLAAARALSPHFDRITIVERDGLDEEDTNESRKGVPQGNHGHGLLASGYRILDTWFPDLMKELVDGGASPVDVTGDFHWHLFGAWKLKRPSGLGGIVFSRPFLEAAVRRRVRALPNVTLLDGHDVDEPVFDENAQRVTGVRVKNRATNETRTLSTDLVVDTTGRGSRAPKWLATWGFGETPESTVRCDIGYTTTTFERRAGDFRDVKGAVIVDTPPAGKRGGALFAVEGGRWVVTLLGALGDHPPTAIEDFRAFARTLPTDDIATLIDAREPLSPVRAYRFPANQRRHFEALGRFPEGFLVLGDAISSFNPVYGQGMSVALCEAEALSDLLASGRRDLARRYFARASALVDIPWSIATGEDLRFPEVEGKRPPGFAILSAYMARVHHASTRDPVVLRRFIEVANLLRPPTAMLAPNVLVRVLLAGRGPDDLSA